MYFAGRGGDKVSVAFVIPLGKFDHCLSWESEGGALQVCNPHKPCKPQPSRGIPTEVTGVLHFACYFSNFSTLLSAIQTNTEGKGIMDLKWPTCKPTV